MRAGARGRSRRGPHRVDYVALADLRYHIRRFLQVREEAARAAGVEPQQYMALLQLKALQARPPATITALAARLLVRHHTAVELVDRLVERGLVRRRRQGSDRRAVTVELHVAGEALLRRLALNSLEELSADGPALVAGLARLLRAHGGLERSVRTKR
jgi:DNA-binding MarR family transcriptional regulator